METINKPTVRYEYIDKLNEGHKVLNYNIDPNNTNALNLGKFFSKQSIDFYCNEVIENINGVLKLDNLEDGYNYTLYSDRSNYIYQSDINQDYIIKIDKDYRNAHNNDFLETVIKLKEYQKYIEKTEFPIGIVTYGNSVVGQITKGYPEYDTLKTIFDNYKLPDNIIAQIYIKLINILTELSSVGILYKDIHSKNIVIKAKDNEEIDVKLIDFDNSLITYYEDINICQKDMFEKMINLLPLLKGRYNQFDFNFKEYLNVEDLLNELNIISSKKII